MIVWRYRFAGLLFESALHLPEWEAFQVDAGENQPDVRIVLHDEASVRPVAAGAPVIGPAEYRFFIRKVAHYHVHGGRRIAVRCEPGADAGQVRLFLLGSALAALCGQLGVLLLHASVVRVGTRTVALCGPTSSGKSTTAAALVAQGAAFVCDDLARFDGNGGRPTVYPAAPRFKLSPDAVAALGWRSTDFERVYPRATKFHVPQVLDDPWSPVPLDGICALEWADGPPRLSTLTGTSALRALVTAATYRPGLLDATGQLATHWRQCMKLIAGVRVYRLARPRAWSALEPAVAKIMEALETVDPRRGIA